MSKNLPRLNHIFRVRKDEVLALSLRNYFRSIAVSKLPSSSRSYDVDFAHVNRTSGFPGMLTHILKELSTTSTYDLLGIALGIRPVWRIPHPLNPVLQLEKFLAKKELDIIHLFNDLAIKHTNSKGVH